MKQVLEALAAQLMALALLALMMGCRAHFGPEPNASFSFAMSTYTHQETSRLELCTVDGVPAVFPAEDGADVFVCERTTWYTDMARPWGTSSNEYYIDTEQEAGSVSGQGLSDNLSETLGEGVLTEAIDAAADVFAPGAGIVEGLSNAGD